MLATRAFVSNCLERLGMNAEPTKVVGRPISIVEAVNRESVGTRSVAVSDKLVELLGAAH